MANLSITNICNNNCVYCFANDARNELGKTSIEAGTFDKALDYLKRSGLKQARLLGGEPTLHPGFRDLAIKAMGRGFEIMLFTNGLISGEMLDFLTALPAGKLSVLLNTIHPEEKNKKGTDRQKEVMHRLGPVIIPGVNIYSPKQDLNYLLEYVASYNLKKEIRLGISHSVLSKNNVYLHPKDYSRIGHKIALFKSEAQKEGVSLGFDCGFVPCMFPAESFDLLSEELKKAGNCCHPIIDMLTDGSFISCYPLSNFMRIKINDQLNAGLLINRFEEALAPYKDVGIYSHCTICPLFTNRCNGGCMSYRIQRFAVRAKNN